MSIGIVDAPSPTSLFPLPTPDAMYRALIERDTSLDGVFVAGITTTGIFCRPGCGARKPRREHVEFFPTAAAALHAGYRPCLRCRPLDNGRAAPEFVSRALALVESRPDQRFTAADLRARGLPPERLSRYFKVHYGLTFQAYHRARRLGRALAPLHDRAPIARAAAVAGFDSESGFRDAFARLFGPGSAARPGDGRAAPVQILIHWLPTPLGPMLAGACDQGICLLEWIDRRGIEAQILTLRKRFGARAAITPAPTLDPSRSPAARSAPAQAHLAALAHQLAAYFAGSLKSFTLPLHAPGTPFQEQVWRELAKIPHGQTRSYLDLARAIGRPTATRAVARANGDNRLAILIPCHRIIGHDGSLTGYGGHLWRKQWLLNHERPREIRG